ncbi:hypothetical protein PMAC_001520 [Pneumocystis sp. 'macacae']|nr:hypothetical protein PMAC_001520 [Pneumocystis sp. 'macacae']
MKAIRLSLRVIIMDLTQTLEKNLAGAVARAVKRRDPGGQNVYQDEEILLALILKEDYKEETKCKEKLKKYCKDLKEADDKFEEVDPKLKEICKDNGKTEAKCTGLKNKVDEKCTPFENKLKTAAKKDISELEDTDCKGNEQQCLFLEGACPDKLKENCNKLRVNCYQKKRKEVAEDVLLRALSGKLKEENSCKKRLKEVCLELSGESDELTVLCFDEKTCENLMTKKESICNSLKSEVENLVKKENENQLQTKCLPLLKKCYFYSTDCKDKDQLECEKLKSSCKEKGVVYGKPGSDFEPTRPGLTVTEEIELQELYEEAAKEGVYIGRPPTRDVAELLLLVSQSGSGSEIKAKCKDVLDKKCKDLKEHKLLKGLCKSDNEATDNGTKECGKLEEKQKDSSLALTKRIGNKYLFGSNLNTVIGWYNLPTFITEKDCRTLESDCLYFGGQGGTDKPCNNLRAACYKKGLDAVANEVLQHELRGSLQGSNPTWFEDLQKKLVKACGELKGLSDELFVLCMNPKNTALTLSTDLRMRAVYLQELLNERRDFPTKKDCRVLGKKCEELGPDSREIWWPCHTLNQHCRRLESAEELEEELLKEKTKNLDVFDQCVEKLNERCNAWNRRNQFVLACLAQNVTCRIITKSVKSKCAALDGHMKTDNIVEEAKNNNGEKEKICTSWVPYCNKYMLSCKNLTTANGGKCEELKEQCKSFIEQEELEVKAIDELKGHLKEKAECKAELDKYCAILKNATNKLNTLCTDGTKKNDDENVRNRLCEKLIERVKKQCPKLEKKLIEAEKKLKERADEYETSRKAAEDALKKANLVLATTKTTNNSSGNKEAATAVVKNEKQFKLVRRDTKVHVAVKVTEEEVTAFDLVSQAFTLYVEIKEECEDSAKKCGFKKECPECEDTCKKINEICSKVKPLDVTEHKVHTETKTETTTTTKIVGQGGKTEDLEKCTSIQTTDTWVTKTSTYTSTSTSTSTITSTVTLTSTRRCKPTRCTTGDEAGDVHPSGGLKMTGWGVMRGVLLGMVVGQNLARGAARAVKRRAQVAQKDEIEEELVLALILKKDLDEQKCKGTLKGYCEELKKMDKDFSTHSKLQEICKNDGETKCTGLKTNVEKKCTSFENKLKTAAGKAISELEDTDCKENEKECLFLEAACPEKLKEKCNDLRNKCYQKKRDEVAEEVLLRALNGDLKDVNECKKKINDVCKVLFQGSDELLKKCIDTSTTCQHLADAAKKKCGSLKTKIDEALTKDKWKEDGHSLLKECHFYGGNCENDKPNCNELRKKCKEEKIVYLPPGSHFDPTRPEPTVMEKVGLEELYQKAAAQGVVIERALEGDLVDLLVLLSGKKEFNKDECKNVLKTNCGSIKHLAESLEELCNNSTKHEDECNKYDTEFKEKKRTLTAKFNGRQFEDSIMAWSNLPEVFNEYECTVLQSNCLYYGQFFEKQCRNVKAACYKRGLDALAKEALRDALRGKFNDKTGKLSEKFPKELMEACKELKSISKELFVLCMQPTDTIGVLLEDLRIKTDLLQDHLNENRDLPTRQHCTDLLKKCEDLGQDSREIEWPCRTLRHHCARLGVAEQLEEVFLQEKVSDLDKFESCVETLRGRCSGWGRRGRTRYALGCVAPNATCTYLTQNVGAKCAVLGERMEKSKVVEEVKKEDKKEETCSNWMPFCSKFMYSCKNLTTNGNHNCEKLKEECKSFIEREELEVKLLDKLKGNLKTQQKCKEELDRYCTEWENAKNGLETLCTDSTGKKDVRDKLCEKLINQVKKQCPVLERKLTKASEELKEKADEYENIKNKAQDALKTANLVLVTTKATNGLGNKEAAAKPDVAKNAAQFRLVRRNLAAKITEDEIKAFDLVSQALSLYVELKEECQDLLKGCGFKEECDKCKDACNTIESKCNGLKPLEVTEHKVQIETKNITITIKETVGPGGEKTGDAEKCTSIRTTDTWITKTSTHTSTSTSTSTTTSTVTLTSTRKCRPTKCTTEGEEAGEVKPSGGLRMRGWGVKGVLLGMMISVMI